VHFQARFCLRQRAAEAVDASDFKKPARRFFGFGASKPKILRKSLARLTDQRSRGDCARWRNQRLKAVNQAHS
jgi:hypothetical protein